MTDESGEEQQLIPVRQSAQNVVEGALRLNLEPGDRLKVLTAFQRHQLALNKQEHDQAEERKRHDREHLFRMVGFFVLIVIVLAALAGGGYAASYASDAETRA